MEKGDNQNTDDDGNGNLSKNEVDVKITPDTYGNDVDVNLCSLTVQCTCTVS